MGGTSLTIACSHASDYSIINILDQVHIFLVVVRPPHEIAWYFIGVFNPSPDQETPYVNLQFPVCIFQ